MDKDFVFRSSVFGGYNKNDVMGYLSELNAEKAALEQQYTVVSRDAVAFSKRVGELEEQTATLSAVTAQLESERQRAIELQRESAAQLTENELLKARIGLLESEKTRLAADCDKLSAVEAQLGAAMLDARVYSEKMMTDAGAKAATVNKETGDAINRAAQRVGALSGSLTELSGLFNEALADLEERVKLLVGDMEKCAGELLGAKSRAAGTAAEGKAPAKEDGASRTGSRGGQGKRSVSGAKTPVSEDGASETDENAVYLFGSV